jgi:CheY-like chemotaxis protein
MIEKRLKLMLVDDDPVNNMVNQKLIKKHIPEVDVIVYSDGRSAYNYFLNHHNNLPELILLDINMPIMSGWQFLDEFVKLNIETIQVYMLTSSIAREDYDKSLTYKPVKGFVVKPLDDEKLKEVLNSFLNQ